MPISPHQLTLEEPISAAPASLDAPTQHGYSDSRLPAQPLPGKRHILDLPPELLIQSLSHLDPPDIATSERVCKDWFSTCRDDACWRTAFFNRYQASTAPGKRLHKSAKTSWKAEYLLRSKMLRLWAKSSAKSRVADLKLSHLTNLELLSQGGALVASSWFAA